MKFYNRQDELKELNLIREQTETQGRMVVLTGRRRVGKTMLSLEFVKEHKHLYLFVSRKNEPLLCEEYLTEFKKHFQLPVIGEIKRFIDIFHLLLELSYKESFTVIIDEFQEFFTINPAVYSEMQHLWDVNKHRSKMNLILVGSVYSLMSKIFTNAKEPLFNRADRQLMISPFSIKNTWNILKDYHIEDPKTLFDFYVITGGIPIYLDMLLTNKATSLEKMLDFIYRQNSPFLEEGKNVLIEEFGKEYGTYFSIMELISLGKTARTEMESILEKNVGGFLDRLENDFAMITKHKPFNAKPGSRLVKYKIKDNFLNFWFHFIYRNRSSVETGNFAYLKEITLRDYSTYAGVILERFFQELLASSEQYNKIGSYWEKNNQNEIDIVAVNDLRKKITIAEVKFQKSKISLKALQHKAKSLLNSYPNYQAEFLALSLEDIEMYLYSPQRKVS